MIELQANQKRGGEFNFFPLAQSFHQKQNYSIMSKSQKGNMKACVLYI